ncbi:MAG TPA: alpha/beta hydrolase [Ramlibacter sp.]|uniref:alpha/beta fold hydrolase n=1 Tax=Ramlibacter sp. TaxID=1917967 RepID=UPI002ED333D1
MSSVLPFSREAGRGPTVLCLHSNASHSGQWRGLMDRLADRFRVVAVDSWGAGRTADWPSDRTIQLADEVDLLEPLLQQASDPAYLVGHSYGGAVALKAALLHPHRFGGLALYEPTLFALVDRIAPHEVDGIRHAVAAGSALLDRGDADGAAGAFIDFWMGPGSWAATPADRKPAVVQSGTNLRRWRHALFTEPATLADLRKLAMPVLVMTGSRSQRSSLSVAELLLRTLPNARGVEFTSLGHMAPVTDPDPINAEIARFLDEVAR